MQPIEALPSADLEHVRGGFIGALLSAAPGILQGVQGIIQASKAGKGGGGGPPGGGPPPGAGGPPPPGAETAAAARGAASGGMPGGMPPSDSGVSVSISINGVAQPTRTA